MTDLLLIGCVCVGVKVSNGKQASLPPAGGLGGKFTTLMLGLGPTGVLPERKRIQTRQETQGSIATDTFYRNDLLL